MIPVPVLTPRLSSYWLRFVTSVPTNVARALVEGLEHDFVANDTELRALAVDSLTNFETVKAFAAEERETPDGVRTLSSRT